MKEKAAESLAEFAQILKGNDRQQNFEQMDLYEEGFGLAFHFLSKKSSAKGTKERKRKVSEEDLHWDVVAVKWRVICHIYYSNF